MSLSSEEWFYKEFGVNAELLIDHAWGWEPTTVADIKAYRPESNSMGSGQVLQSPYAVPKAKIVLQEMADNLSLELVAEKRMTSGITVSISYDRESLTRPDIAKTYRGPVCLDYYGRRVPKPAHGTARLSEYTSSTRMITDAAMELFDSIADSSLLVRRLNITALDVISEEQAAMRNNVPEQLDLFTDYDEAIREREARQEKMVQERRMQEAMLTIKNKYGKNAILKGTNYEEGATARERNRQIGGHHE